MAGIGVTILVLHFASIAAAVGEYVAFSELEAKHTAFYSLGITEG